VKLLPAFLLLLSRAAAADPVAMPNAAPACQQGLAQLAEGSDWLDPATVAGRFEAVIKHQNGLRAKAGVPVLDGQAVRGEALPRGSVAYNVPTRNGLGDEDESTLGRFLASRDRLVRCMYGDQFGLNYVYDFSGNRLVNTRSYAEFYLAGLAGEKVELYRQTGQKEIALWKVGKYEQLGSDSWDPRKKMIHFTTDRSETTAETAPDAPIVTIRFIRSALLELARKGELRAGLLDEESGAAEFVLSREQFLALEKAGAVSVEVPGAAAVPGSP
jgi:hypothetical protein